MRCAAEVRNSLPDLQSHPNIADRIFISSLDSETFDEKKYFSRVALDSLPFIFKIAKFSARFVIICEKSEHDKLWKNLYSSFGLILSRDKPTVGAFFTHDEREVNHFNLLRGDYYFFLSQQVLETKGNAFSDLELYWLNQAMKFGSIHANQRYIQFLYQKLDNDLSSEKAENILIEAIKLCKTNLNLHGSYAYMMLAEAFFRYAMWAQQAGNLNRAQSAITSAINACTKAEEHLNDSAFSIHNASFGEGLNASNSLGLQSPQEAIDFLKGWSVEPQNNREELRPRIGPS